MRVASIRGRGRALLIVLVFASRARAEPISPTTSYSPYETQAIRDAEASLGAEVDRAPDGKTIQRIDFVRIDPIDRHDPVPPGLDQLHATSREGVLRHELLVREGDAWRAALVDESARNLRLLPQLSLVLCVPMRGSAPGTVRLVVITKDVWSLYVDFAIEATGGGLELLDLEPKETNLAGLHQIVLARVVLQPLSFSLGGSYEVPRLDGRWLSLALDANIVASRTSGAQEGSYGSAQIGRPLYSSLTRWAWNVGVVWSDQIYRRYVNAAVDRFIPTPPATTAVPWAYRARTLGETAELTRSFGWETKNDFSIGASLSLASYRVPESPALDPAAVEQFARAALPTGENRVGPYVQWHGYAIDFSHILDFDTLGLQEDYRLGHDLWLRAYPIVRALGSARDLVGIYAAAAYGVAFGDGVARTSVESTIEAEPNGISDASLVAALGVATPRIGIGRLVFGAKVLDRWRNYLNVLSFLGGDTQLRGYPSRYLAGKDLVSMNLEYRSRPVEIASLQFGVSAFYDVGDAVNGLEHLEPKHAVGMGLRAVFPQIERSVLRLDLGFPVASSRPAPDLPPMSFFVAFGQALSLPTPTVPGNDFSN
jgi:hypothetical protein